MVLSTKFLLVLLCRVAQPEKEMSWKVMFKKRTTSQQRTKWLVPKYLLFGDSTLVSGVFLSLLVDPGEVGTGRGGVAGVQTLRRIHPFGWIDVARWCGHSPDLKHSVPKTMTNIQEQDNSKLHCLTKRCRHQLAVNFLAIRVYLLI